MVIGIVTRELVVRARRQIVITLLGIIIAIGTPASATVIKLGTTIAENLLRGTDGRHGYSQGRPPKDHGVGMGRE